MPVRRRHCGGADCRLIRVQDLGSPDVILRSFRDPCIYFRVYTITYRHQQQRYLAARGIVSTGDTRTDSGVQIQSERGSTNLMPKNEILGRGTRDPRKCFYCSLVETHELCAHNWIWSPYVSS